MAVLKNFFLVVPALCILLLLSSCGATTTTTTTGSQSTSAYNNGYKSAPANTPASSSSSQTTSAYNGYKSAPANTPASSSSTTTGSAIVKTTMLMVGGKSTAALTDAQGKTLYYFTPDTSQQVACTSSCAETWPPLLFSGSGKVSVAGSLPGTLDALKNANGNQVVYNKHPLYTFSGDSAPGQTNGEGIANKWFVATPDLAQNV